jgi:hypothetical protein
LWVAWVSNFGELLLQPGEFYRWEWDPMDKIQGTMDND